MPSLAINGGAPVCPNPHLSHSTIGRRERMAVMEVMKSGVLSDFMGVWGDKFYGGKQVQALERKWADYFGTAHAVSMNSATSALYAAVGAAGISPGDEVIVSPYTMTASATAALIYGGIPVFADIDEDTFCITADTIAERFTEHTRAIIAVDLFGHPVDFFKIWPRINRYDITVIEDAAQALGATFYGGQAGNFGDIGVHSLNYHKHIHCGEGGIAVTNDDRLAERLRLIRNHAEVVVGDAGTVDLSNMVGFNYRMGEIEAAIASVQLDRLDGIVRGRRQNAALLTDILHGIPGITTPVTLPGCEHAWYLYAMKYDEQVIGVPRDIFVKAVQAEGVPLFAGYVKPIYLEPLYQKKIAFGKYGYPFTAAHRPIEYHLGDCPVAERMHFKELMYTPVCGMGALETLDFADAMGKVLDHVDELDY